MGLFSKKNNEYKEASKNLNQNKLRDVYSKAHPRG